MRISRRLPALALMLTFTLNVYPVFAQESDGNTNRKSAIQDKIDRADAIVRAHPYFSALGATAGVLATGLILHRLVTFEPKVQTINWSYRTRVAHVQGQTSVLRPGWIDPKHFGLPADVGMIQIDGAVLDSSFANKGVVLKNLVDDQPYLILRRAPLEEPFVAVRINQTGRPELGVQQESIFDGGAETLTDSVVNELNPGWEFFRDGTFSLPASLVRSVK